MHCEFWFVFHPKGSSLGDHARSTIVFAMVLVFSFLVEGLWHLFLGSSGVLLRARKLVEYKGLVNCVFWFVLPQGFL